MFSFRIKAYNGVRFTPSWAAAALTTPPVRSRTWVTLRFRERSTAWERETGPPFAPHPEWRSLAAIIAAWPMTFSISRTFPGQVARPFFTASTADSVE